VVIGRLELVDAGDAKPDPIANKESGGGGPLTVLVNGIPLPDAPPPARCCSNPEGPGCVLLAAMVATGATALWRGCSDQHGGK
jgi:hypothetical protein